MPQLRALEVQQCQQWLWTIAAVYYWSQII